MVFTCGFHIKKGRAWLSPFLLNPDDITDGKITVFTVSIFYSAYLGLIIIATD